KRTSLSIAESRLRDNELEINNLKFSFQEAERKRFDLSLENAQLRIDISEQNNLLGLNAETIQNQNNEITNLKTQILTLQQTINRFEQEKLETVFNSPSQTITYPEVEENQIKPKEMKTAGVQTDKNLDGTQTIFLVVGIVGEDELITDDITIGTLALVNSLISVVNIFLFEGEKYSFGWFAKLLLAYGIFRSSASLIGSMISLGIYGTKGFQYPEFSLLATLTLPVVMFSVKRGLNELEQKLNMSREEVIGENSNEEEFFVWQIVALNINTNNINANAQFTANCCTSDLPSQWGSSGLNSTESVTIQQKEGNNCFLANNSLVTANLVIRVAGLIVTALMSMAMCLIPCIEGKKRKIARNFFRTFVYLPIAVAFISYLVINALIQAKGLNTAGLERCFIDYSLTSSKTGYLQEWITQKFVTLRQLAL
ncbi:11514_t:CDS:2, partial [Racocetra fulgida]